MEDKENMITVTPPGALKLPDEAPEHLRKYLGQTEGQELLGKYVRPPRLKVVQKSSGSPYSDSFDVGDVVIVPSNLLVAPVQKNSKGKPGDFGDPMYLIPLFFYPEWIAVNPIETKGTLPMIRDRTIDPKSRLAAKCQNKALWFEPCPEMNGEKNIRNQEVLNFLVQLVRREDDLDSVPVLMSLTRGSHKSGTNFAGLIQMKGRIPICSCHYEARTVFTPGAKGDYYRIEVQNPMLESGLPGWVTNVDVFSACYEKSVNLKMLYNEQRIIADYDDDARSDPDTVDPAKPPQF